ncbi:MAG: hypothetical protein SFU86_24785 [Pirellulaceae bacterium]|nr:hypothetical protein [Pirellulaceae bacterium]
MKTLVAGLVCLTLAVAVGCTESSSDRPQAVAPAAGVQPNEPVKVVAKKPIAGEADKTFSLSVPFESVRLTQGEGKSMLIGINRGENFREEVSIKVSGLPQGVTLETADPVIKQGDMDAGLMLKAAPDAALGDFTIKVTGHTASSGADFSKEVKLIVAQK